MQTKKFTTLPDFIEIATCFPVDQLVLFRGQSRDYDLRPKIARKDPKLDSTATEKEMLSELRRRGEGALGTAVDMDWDLMTLAQHFGMATRLLDWTSNPLVALWFSCAFAHSDENSYVYLFEVAPDRLINRSKNTSPFGAGPTRVLKPILNNARIVAQSGWFTAHKHSSKTSEFVPLQRNKEVKSAITQIEVPHALHVTLLAQLSTLGVNFQTMFPDVEGLCKHINYLHGH